MWFYSSVLSDSFRRWAELYLLSNIYMYGTQLTHFPHPPFALGLEQLNCCMTIAPPIDWQRDWNNPKYHLLPCPSERLMHNLGSFLHLLLNPLEKNFSWVKPTWKNLFSHIYRLFFSPSCLLLKTCRVIASLLIPLLTNVFLLTCSNSDKLRIKRVLWIILENEMSFITQLLLKNVLNLSKLLMWNFGIQVICRLGTCYNTKT